MKEFDLIRDYFSKLVKNNEPLDNFQAYIQKLIKYCDENNIIIIDDLILDYKNKIYLNLISKISSKDLLPGIYYLIETFRKNGYKIALGSASKNAIPILKKLELLFQTE